MAAHFQRLSRQWRVAAFAALLVFGTFAMAQEFRGGHPQTYVVKRGDTLWDIAGRFLQRPWLWPEIWQANPHIRNPHLIYPGDVLSLAYLNRVGVQPGPRDETPINAVALSDVERFLKDIRIHERIDDMPYVVALEEERLRAAAGDVAYVRGLGDVQPGQRFAVLRPVQEYTMGRRRSCCALVGRDGLDHAGRREVDDWERFWTESMLAEGGVMEHLGYEMRRVNAGVVTRGEVGGIQVSTLLLDDPNREVRAGDKVVPVESIPYDLQFFPHAPTQQFPYQKAQVLAVADMLTSGGPRDVVALSVGARDGIDNGTVFSVWRVGNSVVDKVEFPGDYREEDLVANNRKLRLPDEYASHVMVFRTFDKVSYALVMDSTRPTRVGYELKHPDAPY
ncbi:MAG: LysM domain-containing protein [Pseudoxanthomonas suwonensis]|nr:LysM domain-containing protein [Pseudoxanthomonas suwonensis]